MINTFKANSVLNRIKKVYDVDIDFVNLDEKTFSRAMYRYQTGKVNEVNDFIVTIELSKGNCRTCNRISLNSLLYYKSDAFESIMLRFVEEFYRAMYSEKGGMTVI